MMMVRVHDRFDVSDVEQTALLERSCLHLRERVARAFAQGFVSALEDENSREWLPEYQEKSGL